MYQQAAAAAAVTSKLISNQPWHQQKLTWPRLRRNAEVFKSVEDHPLSRLRFNLTFKSISRAVEKSPTGKSPNYSLIEKF